MRIEVFNAEQTGRQNSVLAWYCARTKPKHEHIAAANLRKNLGLEIFLPRLRVEKATRRGAVRGIEPLFSCYIFLRCVLGEKLAEIKHVNGLRTLVHFGLKIPTIADAVIAELRESFANEEPVPVERELLPGDEVALAGGNFDGMRARVLRNLPAGRRVQILLDILGRQTPVEVDRGAIVPTRNALADLMPALAAPQQARIFG
jgi:transcriptional antiterminator RfaH